MKKVVVIGVLALIAIMGVAIAAHAATDIETVTLTGKTQAKLTMTLDTPVLGTVDFGAAIDPDVPVQRDDSVQVTVKSNKVYDYRVDADADFVGVGGVNVPINHLGWNRGSGGPYAPCAITFDSQLLEAKTGNAGKAYGYSLQLDFGYDADPGVDYSADIVPTAIW